MFRPIDVPPASLAPHSVMATNSLTDPATVLPEVDHVGNGFISIAGYQAQGHSVITIN